MNDFKFYIRSFCLALTTIFISIATTIAQIDTASLTGQVTDPNGAAVAGARVVTNQATNISIDVTTNDEGYYTFASLRPALYTITVEQTGFQAVTRKDVEINIGEKERFDVQLGVGAVSGEVVVTGQSETLLQREDATLGGIVDNRRISTLPLPQRSWDDLLTQVAGTQGDPYTEQSGGTASGRTGAVNIHGVRSLSNNFILDGQDNNSISTNVQEFSTQISRPSIDSLGEFRVITSPFSAEFGRTAGGVISVTTKSGTNDFHGVLYEYHRNRVFDANDFFSNKFGRKKTQRVQNQFGGNVGGPIWKKRAFFFADYEGTRIVQGQLRIATVPLANELGGNFAGNLGGNLFEIFAPNDAGTCVGTGQFVRSGQIFIPATTRPNPCFTNASDANPYRRLQFIRDPFPGNIITSPDAIATKLRALYPAPNAAGRSNNFTRTPNINDNIDRFTTRVDFKINDSNDMFARYAYGLRDRFVPGFFGGVADGTDTSAWGKTKVKSHALVVGWNTILSANIANQFRFGYNYANASSVQEPFGENKNSDFVPGIPDNELVQGGLLGISLSGFSPRLGSPDFLPKFQKSHQFQFTDNLSWTRGSHTFRFGADVMAPLKLDYLDVPFTRGLLGFSNRYTSLPGVNNTGNVVADFLACYPSRAALATLTVVNQRRYMYAFYGQDDWKVTPNLTVNLGLRYDFGSPSYEVNNRQANFDFEAARSTNQTEALASLRLASDGSLENRALIKPDRNNFAPRVGFAYSATDNLVIRGGYGIFYNLIDRMGSEDQIALNPPFLIQYDVTTPNGVLPIGGTTATNGITLSNGFPASTLNLSNVQVRNLHIRAANPESDTPYFQQGSIGLQYEFLNGWFAEANYVHTRGTKLYTPGDIKIYVNSRIDGMVSLVINPGGANEEHIPVAYRFTNSNELRLSRLEDGGYFRLTKTHAANETVRWSSDAVAFFGYNNPTNAARTISPSHRVVYPYFQEVSVPSSFLPGVHEKVFSFRIPSQLTYQNWYLDGYNLSVASAGRCAKISYQGRLSVSGAPATGNYDLQFTIFNQATGGAPQSETLTLPSVPITNGIFTVQLDLNSTFYQTEAARFLEIGARASGGSESFITLAPCQPITDVPFAVNAHYAANAARLGEKSASQFLQLSPSAAQTGNLNISGNGAFGGNLATTGTITSGCRAGFTVIAGGRLCVSAMQPAATFT